MIKINFNRKFADWFSLRLIILLVSILPFKTICALCSAGKPLPLLSHFTDGNFITAQRIFPAGISANCSVSQIEREHLIQFPKGLNNSAVDEIAKSESTVSVRRRDEKEHQLYGKQTILMMDTLVGKPAREIPELLPTNKINFKDVRTVSFIVFSFNSIPG